MWRATLLAIAFALTSGPSLSCTGGRSFHVEEVSRADTVIEGLLLRYDAVIDQEGQMGFHGVPQMPLLIYKAIADEITPINDTDLLVESYCSVGANIVYERNTVGGHIAEETNGDARALQWLGQVLTGTYDHKGCTVKDVSLNVTDSPV